MSKDEARRRWQDARDAEERARWQLEDVPPPVDHAAEQRKRADEKRQVFTSAASAAAGSIAAAVAGAVIGWLIGKRR